MKKTLITIAAICAGLVSARGETYSLNADWRFSWTKAPLPLKNAIASMCEGGKEVTAPEYDDSAWEQVSVPHPVNAHDSFDERAVDAGESTFRRDMMFYRKRFALPEGTGNREEGTVELELKPVEVKGGLMSVPQQTLPANTQTFSRTTTAPAVQDFAAASSGEGEKFKVFVNGKEVKFQHGFGSPVKFDDNTGVSCAFVPVLEALKAAGAELEFVHEPKRIPANKKWLRKLSPTPFVPMVTVKAGGHEIDACVGFTELFVDNGKDKNLTNCEVYRAREKSPIVCGELISLVGYIPGVELKTDTKKKVVELTVGR